MIGKLKCLWPSSLAVVLAAGLLAGCGSTVKLDEPPVESRTPTAVNAASAAGAGGAQGSGAAQSQVATVNLQDGANTASAASSLGRVIYFDYDSFVIKDEFRPLIEGHAKLLAAKQSKHVVIEGHTDERGGSEYNLALGQKRAEAVAKSLELLGASQAQIEAVSYGKERPAVEGHDEAAWAKNRRAEIKDR